MNVQERVYALMVNGERALTADEIALELGMGVLSVRPAVTKLRNEGLLRRTGERRKNASGKSASVLRFPTDYPNDN